MISIKPDVVQSQMVVFLEAVLPSCLVVMMDLGFLGALLGESDRGQLAAELSRWPAARGLSGAL